VSAASPGAVTKSSRSVLAESDSETGLYYYRARYYDPSAGRFPSEDPIKFWGGKNFYRYVHNNAVNFSDPFGLADYNQQQTLDLFLQPAYSDATAGYFKGLWDIRNHSTGGGDFDFAHNEHAGDTFTVCGIKMSAGDFGNYIAGLQAGAWDDAFYGDREIGFSLSHLYQLRYAEATARLAGLYYHLRGDTDARNDPWDKTGWPWITLGANYGRTFSKKGGGCGCSN
jgi:RHS repeat-associated protein